MSANGCHCTGFCDETPGVLDTDGVPCDLLQRFEAEQRERDAAPLLVAALAAILAEAEAHPFCPVGHVIGNLVPGARLALRAAGRST